MNDVMDIGQESPFVGRSLFELLGQHLLSGEDLDDDKCWVIVPEL